MNPEDVVVEFDLPHNAVFIHAQQVITEHDEVDVFVPSRSDLHGKTQLSVFKERVFPQSTFLIDNDERFFEAE